MSVFFAAISRISGNWSAMRSGWSIVSITLGQSTTTRKLIARTAKTT
jgi:hypothetical protein